MEKKAHQWKVLGMSKAPEIRALTPHRVQILGTAGYCTLSVVLLGSGRSRKVVGVLMERRAALSWE